MLEKMAILSKEVSLMLENSQFCENLTLIFIDGFW